MMTVLTSIRPRLALAQAILFCLIVASGTVFMHKHRTHDGRIVIHTHPYNLNKDPDAGRHHQSDTEIHLLDVIFQGSYLQTPFTLFEEPLRTPVYRTYRPYRSLDLPSIRILHAYLRGPPAVA